MDTKKILAELHDERHKLETDIAALEAVSATGARGPGRPAKTAGAGSRHGRLSAAARRKLSRLLKQRWAQGKMRSGGRGRALSASAARSPHRMSRAGRARIAAAQRLRWARVRSQHPQAQVA